MYELTVSSEFEAAHFLRNYAGKYNIFAGKMLMGRNVEKFLEAKGYVRADG